MVDTGNREWLARYYKELICKKDLWCDTLV